MDADEITIRESNRLFLRNLPYKATEEDLREHFAAYGELEEVSRTQFPRRQCIFHDEHQIGTTYAQAVDANFWERILVDASIF